MMSRFTLVGVDGNAFSVMGYTDRALRKAGLQDKVDKMYEEAESGDYYNLLAVCNRYVRMANEALGLIDD
jgi:hypothetical protein